MTGFTHRTTCRACGSSDLAEVLNLGMHPPANAFLREDEFAGELHFPLALYFCRGCSLAQLLDVVDQALLFNKDYAYRTGASAPMREHFRRYVVDEILPRVDIVNPGSDLVVDIGGNDGLLLSHVLNARTINVDPAASGLEAAICEPFTFALAEQILSDQGHAKVITANNVFAHVDDIRDVLEGVRHLLTDDGTFIMEVHWVGDLISRGCFDVIYHEHLCYWSLTSLEKLLNSVGLYINDVKIVESQGKSLRVTANKEENDAFLFFNEERLGLTDEQTFIKFGERAQEKRRLIHDLIWDLTDKRVVAGYGAPAKGNTLINACGLRKALGYLTDTTPEKQGRYSPGAHVPVRSPDHLKEDPPDYALLLTWNHRDAILAQEADLRDRGTKFIVPFPDLVVV